MRCDQVAIVKLVARNCHAWISLDMVCVRQGGVMAIYKRGDFYWYELP